MVDFGYKEVTKEEKTRKVGEVFHSVASKYDVMNDLMSFGVHRIWKKMTISQSNVRAGQRVLDVAAGSCDLSRAFAQKVGPQGLVIASDINESMLSVGRDRMLDKGVHENIQYVLADAEQLPFPDNYFDCISIGFGLRNVTTKENALASMFRILRPGGRLLVLEFSKPVLPGLKTVYDLYSFSLLPRMGQLIASDAESYQYLAESIRKHPDQDTLKKMILDAGFAKCDYTNMSGGIVALHKAYKY